MHHIADGPVTVRLAATLLGVNRTAIYQWIDRGYTDHNGNHTTIDLVDNHGPQRAARYMLSALRAAERATRHSSKSHRQSTAAAA